MHIRYIQANEEISELTKEISKRIHSCDNGNLDYSIWKQRNDIIFKRERNNQWKSFFVRYTTKCPFGVGRSE
jgi:hypothetical protein